MNADPGKYDVFHNKGLSRFEVRLGDKMAFMDYSLEKNRIVFLHTEVPPAYEGRGIAAMMVKAAMEHARAGKLRVISLCSYVSVYLQRHPEYHHLIEKPKR